MPKLRSLAPMVRTASPLVRLPTRPMDPTYHALEYKAWRTQVMQRAGSRCEVVDEHGHRCTRAYPQYRMYADHIVELKDNGHPFDINNGMLVCASHHTEKTIKVRTMRMRE